MGILNAVLGACAVGVVALARAYINTSHDWYILGLLAMAFGLTLDDADTEIIIKTVVEKRRELKVWGRIRDKWHK